MRAESTRLESGALRDPRQGRACGQAHSAAEGGAMKVRRERGCSSPREEARDLTSSVSEHSIGQTGHCGTAADWADPQVRWGEKPRRSMSCPGLLGVVTGTVL